MSENIPEELLKRLLTKDVIPFIGAGFSRNFGYPSWKELLYRLNNKLCEMGIEGVEQIKHDDELEINPLIYAEGLYSLFEKWANEKLKINEGRKEVFKLADVPIINEDITRLELLNKAFNSILISCNTGEEVTEDKVKKYEVLKEFEFKTIVTTNYDSLLEHHIFKGKIENVYYPSKQLEINMKPTYEGIYKIHGDLNNPESIVFTNRQYYSFMRENKYIKNMMYNLFVTSTFLFIGYSFSDINILNIYFNFINDYSSINKHIAYMLILKENNMKPFEYKIYKQYLEYNNIHVIDGFNTLEDFIACLNNELKNYMENKPFEKYRYIDVIKEIIVNKLNYKNPDNIGEAVDELVEFLNDSLKNKYMLQQEPFNLELDECCDISYWDKDKLFDLYIEAFRQKSSLVEKESYFVAVNNILKAIVSEFYFPHHRRYLEDFINIILLMKSFNCNEETKNKICANFIGMLERCGQGSGQCWASYKLLKEKINDIPKRFRSEFLDFAINVLEKENKNYEWEVGYLYGRKIDIWLQKLKELGDELDKEKVDRIFELIRKKEY